MNAPSDNDLIFHIVSLVQQDRTDEAEAILRDIPALPSEGRAILARLLHNRAIALYHPPNGMKEAEGLLCEALSLSPAQEESRRSLGEILLHRAQIAAHIQDFPAAAAAALQAATVWPNIGELLKDTTVPLATTLHDAAVLLSSNQTVASAQAALAAWALNPGDHDLYATIRSILIHLGTGELGPAVDAQIFEEMLRLSPDDPVALLGLSNRMRQEERQNRAEQLCRSALHHPIAQIFAAGRLASILAEEGRFAEADSLYRILGQRGTGIESNIRLDPAFMEELSPQDAPSHFSSLSSAGAPLVVFTCCDGRYFEKYIDALANSLARTGDNLLLHTHVVDPDGGTAARAEEIRRRHPRLDLRLTTEASPADLDANCRRTYFACARFLRMPELLRHYGRPILMLDVDIVVLRPLAPLLAQLETERADLALVFGIPREPWSRLWADILLAAPTEAAYGFLDETARYIAHFFRRKNAAWFLDQVALYAAHNCGHSSPKVLQWPMDIQNSGLEHTYFWSLHVSQPTNSGNETQDLYLSFKKG
jgi:tetratricopeptide (TPR) repeat protein